jgi:hypothetical protein
MASQPLAPVLGLGTAHTLMSGHGEVTFRTAVIIRTSVSTTVPSVDMEARMQGLTLVHCSAQHKRFLWERGCM